MNKIGIYFILKKDTGQLYIGQSINIKERFRQHKKGYTDSRISRAIKKYGEDNFIFGIIEELPFNKEILDNREKFWIKKYKTFEDPNHYNLTPGGDFNPSLVPEIAQRMNKSKIGKKHKEETKKKMREAKLGKKLSKEHKESIKNNSSKYWLGKRFSQEHRNNISKSRIEKGTSKGKNNGMFQKKHKLKSLLKMSNKRNTTGYFRVNKYKCKDVNQGFTWRYQYVNEEGKSKSITSVDITKLEKKVKDKGLPWIKLDEV